MLIVNSTQHGLASQLHVHVDASLLDEALQTGIAELLVRMGIPVSSESDLMESLEGMLGHERAMDVLQAAAMNYFIPQALTQCNIVPLVSPLPHTDQDVVAHVDFDFAVDVYPKPAIALSSYERAQVHIHPMQETTDADIDAQIHMLINVSNATRGENDPEAELTDEWVKQVYAEDGMNSVDDLRQAMRAASEQYNHDAFEESQQNAMLHEWASRLETPVADEIVEALTHEMLSAAEMSLAQQGATLEQYLDSMQTTQDMFTAQMAEEARETLSTSIAMDAIFAHMGTEVTDEVLERVASVTEPEKDPQDTLAQYKADGRFYSLLENAQRTSAVVWAYDNTDFEICQDSDCDCGGCGCGCGCEC